MRIITKSHIEDFIRRLLENDKTIQDALSQSIEDVIASKVNKHPNEVNILDYSDLAVNNDWKDAIDKAIEDVAEGGIVRFPKGKYVTSKQFPTSKSITVLGDNYLDCIIQYSGNLVDGAFVDIRVDGFSMKNITLYGYSKATVTSQDCSGIWVRETESGAAITGVQLERVRTRYFKQDGMKIFKNVWMNFFDKLYSYNNDGNGINISGTDNCFSNIHCLGNGLNGILLGGGNNRLVNVNCIGNALLDSTCAEIRISGYRHSLSNIACQDGNHNGIILYKCYQTSVDLLSDANGIFYATGKETDCNSYSIKVVACENIIGNVRVTNYRSDCGTLYGLYVSDDCTGLDLKYFDVSRSQNDAYIGDQSKNNIINTIKE